LRERGARGDILQQIHVALRRPPTRCHIVRAGQELPTDLAGDTSVLWGRIAGKGLSDELKGAFYAVLETPTGAAYHVPLDRRSAEDLHAGDIVSFATRPEPVVRPIDRDLAAAARAQGGIYRLDPAAGADDGSQTVRRRLCELERLGLVAAAESPGRWRVPPDLLAVLEQRHKDTPARQALRVQRDPLSLDEQIRHRGPVGLDRVVAASLAPYGFGADVRRALECRRQVLRDLGIAPDDPLRGTKLLELERRAVGEGVSARTGQVFLAKTPETFRGRLQPPLEEHAPYAVVSDGARFVLVPPPPSAELRALVGKAIVVSRDGHGQLLVRTPDKERGL